MKTKLVLLSLLCLMASGCTVISYNRVFPKLDWYWTTEAKEQRKETAEYKAGVKAYQESLKTNAP